VLPVGLQGWCSALCSALLVFLCISFFHNHVPFLFFFSFSFVLLELAFLSFFGLGFLRSVVGMFVGYYWGRVGRVGRGFIKLYRGEGGGDEAVGGGGDLAMSGGVNVSYGLGR